MKVLTIISLILLINCKINEKVKQEICEPSKYCIVNIHIADSVYENSVPFMGIKELNNPLNGADTDFEGNAILKIFRPPGDTLFFAISLLGTNKRDTIHIETKKCTEVYYFDYYLPKWYKEYQRKHPVIMLKYNRDINYGNEK